MNCATALTPKHGMLIFQDALGQFESPDFAAERLSVTAGDPDLILKDKRRVLVSFLPRLLHLEFMPAFAVFRVPNVAPVFRGAV